MTTLPERRMEGGTVAGIHDDIEELGRIRIGDEKGTGHGGIGRPLTTFRLTSPDQGLIAAAAGLWGGEPKPWDSERPGEWQVVTTTDAIRVFLPPIDVAWSQAYEQWVGGGCTHRCDGVTCELTRPTGRKVKDGRREYDEHETVHVPCMCDDDQPDCKLTTHVNLVLPDLPGIGVWRLTTHSRTAASRLPAMIRMLRALAGNEMVPCTLRLTARESKKLGRAPRSFIVPQLICDQPVRELMDLPAARSLASGGQRRAELVASTSTPGVEYVVTVNDDGVPECTCPGFEFHGHCKHATAAGAGADPATGEIIVPAPAAPPAQFTAEDGERAIAEAAGLAGMDLEEAKEVARAHGVTTKAHLRDAARVDAACQAIEQAARERAERDADAGGSAPGVDPDQAGGS